MTSDDVVPRYRVFLLRFWQERGLQPDRAVDWRLSLEDPVTQRRHGFTTLTALMAFLDLEMRDAESSLSAQPRQEQQSGIVRKRGIQES